MHEKEKGKLVPYNWELKCSMFGASLASLLKKKLFGKLSFCHGKPHSLLNNPAVLTAKPQRPN